MNESFSLVNGKSVWPAHIEARFTGQGLVAHAVLFGDGRDYLVAGLWLEPKALATWCAAYDRDDLMQGLRQELGAQVAQVNGALSPYETIERFAIMTPELSIDSGHLSARLELRRDQVYTTFAAEFEAMYP